MKKFIKDWWPLLLIAGWLLWKNSQKIIKANISLPSNDATDLPEGAYAGDCYKCGSPTYYKKQHRAVSAEGVWVIAPVCSNPNCPTHSLAY